MLQSVKPDFQMTMKNYYIEVEWLFWIADLNKNTSIIEERKYYY